MTNYDKIYSIAEDCEGYITNKEAEKNGIKRSQLASLANNKSIERVGSGIYKLPNYPIDNLYILSKVSKNMCYSHATALYLHNLIDRIPIIYDVTVPNNYSGNLLNNKNVSLRYTSRELYQLGISTVKTINGLKVTCYDIERTICDIVKDKKNIDKEIYTKALKEYAVSNNKNLLKLIKYAKKLNIEKQIVEIMEILL